MAIRWRATVVGSSTTTQGRAHLSQPISPHSISDHAQKGLVLRKSWLNEFLKQSFQRLEWIENLGTSPSTHMATRKLFNYISRGSNVLFLRQGFTMLLLITWNLHVDLPLPQMLALKVCTPIPCYNEYILFHYNKNSGVRN